MRTFYTLSYINLLFSKYFSYLIPFSDFCGTSFSIIVWWLCLFYFSFWCSSFCFESPYWSSFCTFLSSFSFGLLCLFLNRDFIFFLSYLFLCISLFYWSLYLVLSYCLSCTNLSYLHEIQMNFGAKVINFILIIKYLRKVL